MTPTLHLLFLDQPSVVRGVEITSLYNLATTTLELRGNMISSSLFRRFSLGMVSKSFLKSTKQ